MANILFVDDEEDIINILKIQFIKEMNDPDMHLHFFTRGKEALSFINDPQTDNIDAIVTDINMPLYTGVELLTDLRESNQNIMCYFCSAYDKAEYEQYFDPLKISGFFKKPVGIKEIKSLLRKDLLKNNIKCSFS